MKAPDQPDSTIRRRKLLRHPVAISAGNEGKCNIRSNSQSSQRRTGECTNSSLDSASSGNLFSESVAVPQTQLHLSVDDLSGVRALKCIVASFGRQTGMLEPRKCAPVLGMLSLTCDIGMDILLLATHHTRLHIPSRSCVQQTA